jgi:hypothetical protein
LGAQLLNVASGCVRAKECVFDRACQSSGQRHLCGLMGFGAHFQYSASPRAGNAAG